MGKTDEANPALLDQTVRTFLPPFCKNAREGDVVGY